MDCYARCLAINQIGVRETVQKYKITQYHCDQSSVRSRRRTSGCQSTKIILICPKPIRSAASVRDRLCKNFFYELFVVIFCLSRFVFTTRHCLPQVFNRSWWQMRNSQVQLCNKWLRKCIRIGQTIQTSVLPCLLRSHEMRPAVGREMFGLQLSPPIGK